MDPLSVGVISGILGVAVGLLIAHAIDKAESDVEQHDADYSGDEDQPRVG